MYIEDGSNHDYGNNDLIAFSHYVASSLVYGRRHKESLSEILEHACSNSPPLDNIYAWGWLGKTVPKKKQWKDPDRKFRFAEAMRAIDREYPHVDHFCGCHTCEICGSHYFEGTIKIEHEGLIFACPSGVDHYIEDHNYKPDDRVILAVEEGKVLSQGDLIKKGYALYRNEIAKEMREIKKKMWESERRAEANRKEKEKYWKSLTAPQRSIIERALKGKLDVIPLD